MSEVTNDMMIQKSLDINSLQDLINTNGTNSGDYIYSISIGVSCRGARVDMHLGHERFAQILKQYPILDEYNRLFVSQLSGGDYCVNYIIPCYDDKVNVAMIARSFDELSNILGDAVNHIEIVVR